MFALFETMRTAVQRRIERAWHARHVGRERRRLDALYGPRPLMAAPEQRGAAGQADVIARVAARYLGRAEAALEAHGAAAIKLDALDYAFGQLLKDLGDVMGDLPSQWSPECRLAPADAARSPRVAVAA